MCKTCVPDARRSSSLDPLNSETWNLHHLREGFRGHRECGPVDNAVLPLTAATSIAATVARRLRYDKLITRSRLTGC